MGGRTGEWRRRREARRPPNPAAWLGMAVISLVGAIGIAVGILTLHGPGHTSVPIWFFWLLVVLWLATAAQALRNARIDRARLRT